MSPKGPNPDKEGGILQLKDLIIAAGYNYSSFAPLVDSTRATVQQHCTGHSLPKEEMLLKYAEVLNVDVRDLFKPSIEGVELKYPRGFKGRGKVQK